jgi:hypothetical protein
MKYKNIRSIMYLALQRCRLYKYNLYKKNYYVIALLITDIAIFQTTNKTSHQTNISDSLCHWDFMASQKSCFYGFFCNESFFTAVCFVCGQQWRIYRICSCRQPCDGISWLRACIRTGHLILQDRI